MKIFKIFKKEEKIDKEKIKTWFVTGASSGLGYEITKQLLDKGYNVIAVARRVPDFNSENALCLSVDVTNVDNVNNAIQKGIEKFGKIDVILNSAGIWSGLTCEEEAPEYMRKVMEVNFWGTYNTIHSLLPHFRGNKNGTIINISSASGIVPRAFGAAYCSSKHAVEGLTAGLWHETKRFCRTMVVELSYFRGTDISNIEKKGSDLPEYKKLPWHPLKTKNNLDNDLATAVKFIIEETEKLKLQRRLMLGEDIIKKVNFEINSMKEDLRKSKRRAILCAKPKGVQ